MAYGEKYTFRFDSQEGKDWKVVIFEEGYTGTPVSRCVGGHPLLRMESNGCIRGMSLELPAECVVADEYADLYTSDPVRFKVSVYLDHDEVWQGFITPELYSAPWVDPPHDVALTATDGLGELKRQNYARGGRMSLATHLGNLLAATGLTLPIRMVSSLESDVNDAGDFLSGTLINLDHLSGETMYDALQAILASIHATVRQCGGSWLLIRETDISGSSAGSEVDDTEGDPIPIVPFGSMNSFDVWPVGRLTSEIVPARNSVTVTSDNESDREFLDDPDMTEGSWDGDATHSSEDGGYYQMAVGESISQEVSMPEMPSTTVEVPDMRLKVTARQADTAKAHNIRIKVSSYMYLAVSGRHETYWLSENSSGELVWTDVDGYLDREIPAAAVSRSTDCTSIEMVIPVTRHSQRDERKIPETVTVEFASDDNTVYVHAASLGIIPQWAGIETRVTIGNGARGGDSPVGVMFADSEAYNRGLTWMSNCAYGLGTDIVPVHTLASGPITAAGTGVFLAQDYAMSVANPRLSLKGVLQIPSGVPIPVFLSTDDIVFLAEEWSYDLITDELDVSMISLPAVEIEVEDVTQESYSEKGGGGTRASASSGGSAPATPPARTLDWFIPESYEENGETRYRLKLNPKYVGMYAEGWVSAGGVSGQGGGGGASYLRDLLDVDDNIDSTSNYGKYLYFDATLGKWTAKEASGTPVTEETVAGWGFTKNIGTVTGVKVGNTSYSPDNGVVSLPAYPTTLPASDVSAWAKKSSLAASDVPSLAISKISGLQNALDNKQPLDSDLTAIAALTGTSGLLRKTNGTWGLDTASYVTTSALNTALDGYLPLSGGTLTGDLFLTAGSSSIYIHGSGGSMLYGTVSTLETTGYTVIGQALGNTYLRGQNNPVYRKYDSVGNFQEYTMWHEGNANLPSVDWTARELTAATSLIIGTTTKAKASPMVWDETNNAWHLQGNLYADGFISAGGVSSAGGGASSYLRDLLDVDDNIDSTSNYGKYLYYDGTLGKWTAREASGTQGTVTSVALTVPTGLSVSGSPVTSSGTIAISLASGYSIPTTAKQTQWSTAYGWGDHSQAGYAMASALSGYLPLTGGTLTGNLFLTSGVASIYVSGSGSSMLYGSTSTSGNIGETVIGQAFGNTYLRGQNNPTYRKYNSAGNYQEYTMWHAGNDGAGSELDADLLDGKHLAEILASNVASATKLETARTIWGQSFDGTGNISGAMAGVTTVNSFINAARGSSNVAYLFLTNVYASVDYVHIFVSNQDKSTTHRPLVLQDGYGNVGVGISNPSYKLDVNGSARIAGTLTSQAIQPSTTSTSQSTGYDLGASTAFWKNTYTRRIYLADGIYVYYDSENQCIRSNAPIASDSWISAGGVSTT